MPLFGQYLSGGKLNKKYLGMFSRVLCTSALLVAMCQVSAHADVKSLYEQTCATCHATGALNAPKTGDKAVWQKLKQEKGMDKLVQATKNGMPQMPAGGLCSQCSNQDFQELIEYMSH